MICRRPVAARCPVMAEPDMPLLTPSQAASMQQAVNDLDTRVEQQGALLAILMAQQEQEQQAEQAQHAQQAQQEGGGTAGPAAHEQLQLQQLAAQLEEQGQQRQRMESEVEGNLQLKVALVGGCTASAMLPPAFRAEVRSCAVA